MIKYCKQCLNQEPSVYSSKKKTEKVRTKASGLNYKSI